MASRNDIIRWSDLIGEATPLEDIGDKLEGLPADEQGRAIHSYLESEFSDIEDLRWENPVVFQDEDGDWRQRKYDAYDGNFVYEFKTKWSQSMDHEYLPQDDHISQIQDYLKATSTDWGVLVYISRDEFEVMEYLVSSDE